MIYFFFVFAIYALLQKVLIDWPIIRRIKRAQNAQEAISCRKKLKFRRGLFLVLYVILIVISPNIPMTLSSIQKTGECDSQSLSWIFFCPIFLYAYLVPGKKIGTLLGNISLFDKTTFLAKNADYVLYLRGFERDDYESEAKQLKHLKANIKPAKRRKKANNFSEYFFTRVLQSKSTVCAVGMSKEIDAPVGAHRVYLDDETWQADVLDLMQSAKKIYILVNDRPSCIWEIAQSFDMLEKTVFLIDEAEKYESVRALGAEHGIEFPEMPCPEGRKESDFFAVIFDDGVGRCYSYDKSVVGYAKMLDVPVPHIRKPGDLGWDFLVVCVITALVFLVSLWLGKSYAKTWMKNLAQMQGVEQWVDKHDGSNRITSRLFCDSNGSPMLNKDGIAEIRYQYDSPRNSMKLSYFGINGEPKLCNDGFAGTVLEYDNKGNVTRLLHFGTDGKPIMAKQGFSEVRFGYDKSGNKTSTQYFDKNGTLIGTE